MIKLLYTALGGEGGGAGTGGGGAANQPQDWRLAIPETIRGEANLKDFKNVGDLAQSYLSAQRLIGVDKIAKPLPTWKPEQLDEFYNTIGRPSKPEEYTFKADKLPEGVQIDDAKLGEVKKHLHSLGLTDKQASGALTYYLESIGRSTTELTQQQETARNTALTELKNSWGADFDAKLNMAKAVVQKFGGAENESIKQLIEQNGNNPGFIKLFADIGAAMMEDQATGSGRGDLFITDKTRAVQEINSLKGDKDFQAALSDRSNPGHQAALDQWTLLHSKAYSE